MLTLITFASCLFFTLTSGQTNNIVAYPQLGPVYSVANNDSVLNFTLIYPNNYTFDNLYVRFTIYDFIGNNKLNPQLYPFSWTNFTNSNTSLPWVVPDVILQSGDYIIACFEWVETDNTATRLVDTTQCILTRTAMNSTLLAIANPMINMSMITNTTATISVYYPVTLPYDQVNISSMSNGTILPSTINSSSNALYMPIYTFSYMNLIPNTCYDICIYISYSNSLIAGTQGMNSYCQIIMTLGGNGNSPNTTPNNTPYNTYTNTPYNTYTNTPNNTYNTTPNNTSNNTSNKMISNMTLIILLFIFAFI